MTTTDELADFAESVAYDDLADDVREELDVLRDAALAPLDSIEPPNLFTYLCP